MLCVRVHPSGRQRDRSTFLERDQDRYRIRPLVIRRRADYAWDGGEGDRCLENRREINREYIERECQRIGLEPNTKRRS
jgi:hypothetical protein